MLDRHTGQESANEWIRIRINLLLLVPVLKILAGHSHNCACGHIDIKISKFLFSKNCSPIGLSPTLESEGILTLKKSH